MGSQHPFPRLEEEVGRGWDPSIHSPGWRRRWGGGGIPAATPRLEKEEVGRGWVTGWEARLAKCEFRFDVFSNWLLL